MSAAARVVVVGLLVIALLIAAFSVFAPAPRTPSTAPSPAPFTPTPSTSSTGMPADGRPILPVPDVVPEGFVAPPAGSAGLDRYREQEIGWQACGKLQCATVRAPVDYQRPDEQALTLALAKRPATGVRRGTLFINPGGPGGSGVEYVGFFDAKGLEDFDIVGWDPRGVGGSTPARCFEGAELDRFYAIDVSPDDGGELDALIENRKEFGASCLERSGSLLEHISTIDTVRDLDLLRSLVGDDKINYLGSSYGTRIGALYAELFPKRVGHLVLDGAVSLEANPSVTQIEGFERALEHFATWCAERRCRLGSTQDEVLGALVSFLDRLDQQPMTTSGGRTLSQQQGVEAVFYAMYAGERGWNALGGSMAQAVFDGSADNLLLLADASNRRSDDGRYDQLSYGFPAIRCLDSQADSVREAERDLRRAERVAPVMARLGGADLLCPLWPVKSAPPQPKVTGAGAAPIVVIGTTGDPATPYEYAPAMADQLESGVLITLEGEGHLAYGKSECVRLLVRDYLIKDAVPADRSRCQF